MAMTESCKRLAVGGDKLDRLTDLPVNVLHCIQKHMSIEDASRMSVLSRPWRHVWGSNPKLVFGMHFCRKKNVLATIEIISSILLQHQGAIKKFLLGFPKIHSSQHTVIDEWMLMLSRNGLVNLTLQNPNNVNAPYELPSYVYGVELECLYLSNCIFRPPCSFRGFHKLKKLSLKQVIFELDVATSSLWMPSLESLRFVECTGLRFLNVYAPELIHLCFHDCGTDTVKLSPFVDCGKLRAVGLLSEEVSQNRQDKSIKLINLLSSWHDVSRLFLGRCFLKFLPSGIEEERLPASLNRLRFIYFHDYNFDDEDLIYPLLCIHRSSPNLEELNFRMHQRKKGDVKVNLNLPEGAERRIQGLNNLQKFKIAGFRGSRNELSFARFVLASAPLLQKAVFLVRTSVKERRSLKISTELMQFPRASPESEITYQPWSSEIKIQSRNDGDSSKSLEVGGNKLERLTNLPINVIHQIQDHMSIEDAARMSVLSRAWRYVWASNPNLVFDEKISSIIISTIVSQHHGAIKKFHATIPSFDHSTVDDWMLLLSRNGTVELTIDNTSDVNAPYRLPLCVYGMKLEGLYLSNCIFRPPCSSFQNFHRLKGLSLNLVSFDKLDVAISSSLWMPNLERLIFCNCNGLHLVNIYAPKLLLLMVLFCDTDFLTIGTFMDCEKLENVKITFRKNVSQNRRDKAIKLTHLLSSWPNLSKLLLDRYVLEFFAPGKQVERLPASLNRLRKLRLHNFDFDCETIISPLLFIFRSCPNLKTIVFKLFQRKNIMETDANLLEGSAWSRTQGLDNLKKLKIKGFHGSTNEFVFVKSILISAPLLQKVSLLVHNSSLHQIRLLRKGLMRFPRASTKLKLKCESLRGK